MLAATGDRERDQATFENTVTNQRAGEYWDKRRDPPRKKRLVFDEKDNVTLDFSKREEPKFMVPESLKEQGQQKMLND